MSRVDRFEENVRLRFCTKLSTPLGVVPVILL